MAPAHTAFLLRRVGYPIDSIFSYRIAIISLEILRNFKLHEKVLIFKYVNIIYDRCVIFNICKLKSKYFFIIQLIFATVSSLTFVTFKFCISTLFSCSMLWITRTTKIDD